MIPSELRESRVRMGIACLSMFATGFALGALTVLIAVVVT